MRYLRQTVALFALGFLGLYYGWDVVRDPKATATRSEPQVAGGVARVRRAPIPRQLQLEGTLLPMAQTQVVAPIAGQLIELRFKTGDFVAAGAVVGAIASADLATRLTGQQASVDAARQSLQATEDELQAATLRLDALSGTRRPRFDRAPRSGGAGGRSRNGSGSGGACASQCPQQEALLGQLQVMHSMIKLTAPASGRVSRVLVGPGTMVNQNRLIMTLDADGALKLIGITRGPLADLSPGVKARVWTTTLPGIIAHGAVFRATVMESADSSETLLRFRSTIRQSPFNQGCRPEPW